MGLNAVSPGHPKPDDKDMVTIYVGRGIRGVASQSERAQVLPVGINGYEYKVPLGAKSTVPRAVYQQMMNSRSRTVVVDLEKANKAPREFSGSAYSNSPTKTETLMDYEIELLKEGA